MHSPQYIIFLNSVQWLAAPASAQLQQHQGTLAADELALDWDNAWSLADGLLESRELSVEAYEAAAQLESEWPSNASAAFWSDEALACNERWKILRERALTLLKIMERS